MLVLNYITKFLKTTTKKLFVTKYYFKTCSSKLKHDLLLFIFIEKSQMILFIFVENHKNFYLLFKFISSFLQSKTVLNLQP